MYHGEMVKEKILKAGLKVWRENPQILNASEIARAAGMHRNAVRYHFPFDELYDAIAAKAVEENDSRIIVQLIAINHAAVAHISKKEKLRHFMSVCG